MKRIALLLLIGFSIVACDNVVDPDPDPVIPPVPTGLNKIFVKVHVPPNSLSTYATEDASTSENYIDSLFIDLYEGAVSTLIHQAKFGHSDLTITNDSIINIEYTVDNISTSTGLKVKVFANTRTPTKITSEIDLPATNHYFYMSGEDDLHSAAPSGAGYRGEVHIERNVAKLRILVSKNAVYMPSDLEIDYPNIKVRIINATDSTHAFKGSDITASSGIGYFNYAMRTGSALRPIIPFASLPNGGQIDSLYVYENRRADWSTTGAGYITQIEVTIPTKSLSEGNKETPYPAIPIYTNLTLNNVLRNHIYTLNIKVQGQSSDPLITLGIEPWNDVSIDGSIPGTYLTVDKTEIVFDPTGLATIDFCSDAQAIYFDFSEFNANNSVTLNQEIKAVGIDTSLTSSGGFPLAPTGIRLSPTEIKDFKDAQILLDKQHCGTFGFKLDLSKFPNFPAVSFSGKICLSAGNIVRCLTFPANKIYDAHFIVGDTLLNGELFKKADVESGVSWLKVSPNRLYTNAAVSNWPTSGNPVSMLYLHLDEYIPTNALVVPAPRTASITLKNNNDVDKIIHITQLPAIYVGRFGYSPLATIDNPIYSAALFTEQLYEFRTMPVFFKPQGSLTTDDGRVFPDNSLYNGRFTAINASVTSAFEMARYTTPPYLDYQATIFEAINYCAYKNRDENLNGTLETSEIKWYLPSQAQLMGMWVSYKAYKNAANSNFPVDKIESTHLETYNFWSSTDNTGYSTQSQFVNFNYGNVGHYERMSQYWARCVRDVAVAGSSGMVSGATSPVINFRNGLPADAIINVSKNNMSGDELSAINETLYEQLRVATSDLNSGALMQWSLTACNTYSEPGYTSGWRLPTQRELQAIWILQDDIKAVCSTFNLLSDFYYWSATTASAPGTYGYNAWTVYGGKTPLGGAGNTPHQLQETPLKVRCVREAP